MLQAEFGFKADPNMKDQLKYAFDNGIRFMVLFGEEELNAGASLKDHPRTVVQLMRFLLMFHAMISATFAQF